jgi:hypothetical protein
MHQFGYMSVLAALLGRVTAAPFTADPLFPRQADNGAVVYLVNCDGGLTQSQLNYYTNGLTLSRSDEQPDAVAQVSSGTFPGG